MCGIAGFAGAGSAADLRRMTGALAHRGPDAEGVYADAGVRLGHRRLSIIDLRDGAQPMETEDGGLCVVFNGEIYNHSELRCELEGAGARFRTDHSDTEVLLHGYREWGVKIVDRLNGMWAFALYDRAKGRLFCSRDRFGKKPFYYFHRGGVFAFASELAALLEHPAAPRSVDPRAVAKFMAYCLIPSPLSLIKGVCKLPAGHNLIFDTNGGTPRVERYWSYQPEPFGDIPRDAEEAWGEELRLLLERAVRRRLIADVPLGIFLSGGIDSTAVAVAAARGLEGGALSTFSIGFTEPSFDESAYAEKAARLAGSQHHNETLDIDRTREVLPQILDHLDEPQGDGSLLPSWLLCRFARRHVTVALGGDGGDELFAGYDPFRALRRARWYRSLVPRPVHRGIELAASSLPVSHRNLSMDFKIKRVLRGLNHPPSQWLPSWMGALDAEDARRFAGVEMSDEELYSEAIEAWDSTQGSDVDRAGQFFIRLYLQDGVLAKMDRASMLHSLEVRCPFLDIELVDFVRRIPADWKLRGGRTKAVLKNALRPWLPAEILERRKKGFGSPLGQWFRDGGLALPETESFNPRFSAERLARHRAGRSDERQFLWCDYVLGKWMTQHKPTAVP